MPTIPYSEKERQAAEAVLAKRAINRAVKAALVDMLNAPRRTQAELDRLVRMIRGA